MVYTEDIWSVLDDLNAAASPNTSQLINAALGSLQDAYRSDRANRTPLEFAKLRLDSLKDMLDQRPCHEGLKKIRDLVEALVSMFNDQQLIHKAVHAITGTGYVTHDELLRICLEGAQSTFRDQRDSCKYWLNSGHFDEELDGFDSIILYGYSDQVLDVLRRIVVDLERTPTLYVLECRTKTQHTATGRLVYHDGHRYATSIRAQLGQGPHIVLVPDSAAGRILEDVFPTDKTLVLFGSNAITLDGSLVHSMGHISVAAAAKCARYRGHTQVYVLTDGLKIGGTFDEVKPHEQRQRNKRYWLTSDANTLSSLDAAKVVSVNCQEDLVPNELIDKILVLDRGEAIPAAGNGARERIKACEFNALREFCEKLHKRVIAHNVRSVLDRECAQEPGLLHSVLSLPVFLDSKVKDIDSLCYVIAERALKGEQVGTLEGASHGSWLPIWGEAARGVESDVVSAIETFRRCLAEKYPFQRPRIPPAAVTAPDRTVARQAS